MAAATPPAPTARPLLRRVGIGLAVAATAAVVGLILMPIATVLVSSFWSKPFLQQAGSLTLANFGKILGNPRTLELLRNTGLYTLGGASLAVLLGATMAWITTRVKLPLPRLLAILPVMPLFLPALLKDTSWIQLFSPRTGLVNLGLMSLFGLENPPFNIFSLTGMIVNAGLSLAPIAYLILIGPMGALDRALEEASFASGAGLLRTVFRVTLPAVMPGIISAFALISIIVACSFETPIIIGLPGGVSTYMSTIYNSMSGGSSPNFSMASAQAVVYLAMIGVLLAWYLWATRREGKYALIANRGGSSGRIDVGGWRWLLFAIVVFYWIAAFAAFLVMALLISLIPFYTVTGENPFRNFNLDNYRKVIEGGAVDAVWGSIALALIVALCATAVALLLAMVSLRSKWRFRRLADAVGTIPIAIPPLIFSVALLITVLSVPGLKLLYNSWTPMILASVVAFLPFALRAVSTGLIAIPRSMEEASVASGAGPVRTLLQVTLPILTPSLISAALLVFVYSLRELAAVALLVRPGTALLPTQIFQYLQVGQFNLANTLNVISIVIAAAVVGLLVLLQRLARAGLAARQRRLSALPGEGWQAPGGQPAGAVVQG